MNKIRFTIVLSIILLLLPFSNILAGPGSETDKKERSEISGSERSILLAQTDTSVSETDAYSFDDDLMFDDEFMDDLEDFEESHVYIADPFEPVNRVFFHLNDKLYYWVLKPTARGYSTVVPEPARKGIRNFFKNLSFPVRFVNCLFQGKFEGAGIEVDRFLINSTIGLAGFMDIAANKFEMKEYDEDLGQTLGSYGIGHGFFINWPFLGASSVTNTIGSLGDSFLDPLYYADMKTKYDIALWGFETVNDTSLRIGDYEALKKAALDPYVAYRNAIYQHWQSEIKK